MATEASIEYLTRPSQIDVDVDVTSSVSEISRRDKQREKSQLGGSQGKNQGACACQGRKGRSNQSAGGLVPIRTRGHDSRP